MARCQSSKDQVWKNHFELCCWRTSSSAHESYGTGFWCLTVGCAGVLSANRRLDCIFEGARHSVRFEIGRVILPCWFQHHANLVIECIGHWTLPATFLNSTALRRKCVNTLSKSL